MKQMEEEAKDLEKVDEEVDKEPAPKEEIEKKGNGKLIMKEEVSEGHVSWSSSKRFFSHLTKSLFTLSSQTLHRKSRWFLVLACIWNLCRHSTGHGRINDLVSGILGISVRGRDQTCERLIVCFKL